MSTVPRVAEALQDVLGRVAQEAGQVSGFIKRVRKLDGASFSQALVFGWLSEGNASSSQLNQAAATVGVNISAQGLEKRFTAEAAACLEMVLEAAVSQAISAGEVGIELLERFAGVYLLDSSTLHLPDVLAGVWAGGGGSQRGEAAVKLQVRLNYSSGALQELWLQAGREHDQCPRVQALELPAGALQVLDSGYFKLDWMEQQAQAGVFWLTRLKVGTLLYHATGEPLCLLDWLQHQHSDHLDLPILLGQTHQLPCRLLAWRVPPDKAQAQRRKLRADARRAGRMVSPTRLALADWTLLVTNIPSQTASLQEACLLYRVRWQMELLFKLWKSIGGLATSRSQNPWRILCEFYAKLIAMLIQHWCVLIRFWSFPNRSLTKAAYTLQQHAFHLAVAFQQGFERLCEALAVIDRCLAAGCRIDPRRTHPNTYQLLLDLALFSLS